MKKFILFLVIIILPPSPVSAAGSFLFEQELRPILEQKPSLSRYMLATLDFAESGSANRIGFQVNRSLGGKRVGPYEILAKPKGAGGAFTLRLTVNTNIRYFDKQGSETQIENASAVKEELLDVFLDAVEK